MNIKLILTLITSSLMLSMASTTINAKPAKGASSAYNSKELMSADSLPAWFKETVAREKKVKKKSKFKLKKFNINKKVVGKIKLIEEAEGTWYYNIDIGTDSPVECYVFSEFDGPANSLYGIIENSLTSVAEINKKPFKNKFNYAVGSSVISDTPYLLFDTLYVLGEQGAEPTLGVLKALSAETNESLQFCMHNEIGYRETFFSVFESFVNAFVESEKSPEFFESVVQVSLGGLNLGYIREKFIVDADGDIQTTYESSMIAPVDASSVSRVDSESNSWSTADGALINENEFSVENGVLVSNLSIGPKDGKWQVEGVYQEKDVKYELKYTDWLLSAYGSYLGTINLAKSNEDSAKYFMWSPDADPSSALPIVLSKIHNNPSVNFELNMGPLVMQYKAESNGVFRNGTFEQGPIKMDFNNVYSKGQPSLK